MGFFAGNETSLSNLQQFPTLLDTSIDSQHGQDQIFQIFRILSRVFSTTEVLQLCDLVRSVPQETISQSADRHRLDTSFSTTEPLSLPKAYRPQFPNPNGAEDVLPQAASNRQDHFGKVLAPSRPDVYNTFPLPLRQPVSADWYVCIACDSSYATSSGLKKHQSSFCEREFDWVCPSCPNLVFYQETELHKHHRSTHAETCSSCRDTQKSLPSDDCKAVLSQCFRGGSEKKAWGCPCCLSCFDTMEAWNQHMTTHQIHNERVQSWSFSIMFRSLLLHRGLAAVYHRYNWQCCDWASLRKSECQTLRSALERHVLPPNLCDHKDFAHLGLPESLVWYAFQLGTVGNIYASATNVNGSQSAVAEMPCYNNGPSNQRSVFPPMVLPMALDSYAEADFEIFTNFERDEQQCLPSTLAFESADGEELESADCFPLQYRSAFGTTKQVHNSNCGPRAESRTDPAILGAYTQTSQNGTGKARTKRKVAQRRKLAEGRLLAK